mmetsp:Transcript_14957/g.47034  ORF Transcript_14957/g.47034 Transcript_14957/m.47034 type:complete len:92 (+) Transcript_14957:634-909(+)
MGAWTKVPKTTARPSRVESIGSAPFVVPLWATMSPKPQRHPPVAIFVGTGRSISAASYRPKRREDHRASEVVILSDDEEPNRDKRATTGEA